MTNHRRLSASEMCTYPWSFADELVLWDELELHQVGLLAGKVDAHGREDAVAKLHERSMTATTVITGNFDLSDPGSWDEKREAVKSAIDLAAEVGGAVYFTPGRRDGRSFDELTASLAEAVAPCVDYAGERDVPLAIEPTQRTDQSFVHTLRDSLDVADRARISVIADLGNCWTERDYEDVVRHAGTHIAVVQFSDVPYGTSADPYPGRVVPGDGDLDVAGFIRAALDAGYEGAFELEVVGRAIDDEGHGPALRRSVAYANAVLADVVP